MSSEMLEAHSQFAALYITRDADALDFMALVYHIVQAKKVKNDRFIMHASRCSVAERDVVA